jgi:hypothetical protein
MIKHIKGCLQFLIYSNLFTGLCACCLSVSSFYFANITPQGTDINSIVATGLFMTLGYQFPYTYHTNWFTNNTRLAWFYNHHRGIKILVILEIAALILLFFQMHWHQVFLFFHLAIIGWCYYLGFTWHSTHYTLRNLPYAKTLTIGYVWAVATVIIPLATYLTHIHLQETILLMMMRMALVGSLCLIFDLRDKEQDAHSQLPTLPVKYGLSITYGFIYALLGLYCLVLLFTFGCTIFSMGCILIAVWILKLLKWQPTRTDDFFYLVLVDGTMILPFIVCVVLHSNHA